MISINQERFTEDKICLVTAQNNHDSNFALSCKLVRSPMVEGFEIYNFFYLTGNINTGLSGSQVKKETFMLGVVADPVALAKYRL